MVVDKVPSAFGLEYYVDIIGNLFLADGLGASHNLYCALETGHYLYDKIP